MTAKYDDILYKYDEQTTLLTYDGSIITVTESPMFKRPEGKVSSLRFSGEVVTHNYNGKVSSFRPNGEISNDRYNGNVSLLGTPRGSVS